MRNRQSFAAIADTLNARGVEGNGRPPTLSPSCLRLRSPAWRRPREELGHVASAQLGEELRAPLQMSDIRRLPIQDWALPIESRSQRRLSQPTPSIRGLVSGGENLYARLASVHAEALPSVGSRATRAGTLSCPPGNRWAWAEANGASLRHFWANLMKFWSAETTASTSTRWQLICESTGVPGVTR